MKMVRACTLADVRTDSLKPYRVADEYVRLIGIGHAAGLLANRGLLGNIRTQSAPRTAPRQPITDEDVEKWNDLMDRLERHNQGQ
jgi:hypothetical protein